jgi:hypothetical protein
MDYRVIFSIPHPNPSRFGGGANRDRCFWTVLLPKNTCGSCPPFLGRGD